MDPIQIIDGKFYTKPPEPVEIPRETIQGWLTNAQTELAKAQSAREALITDQDESITGWSTQIVAIQTLLAQVQE